MEETGLSARSAADQLGHAKPWLTADIYMGRRNGRPVRPKCSKISTSPDWLSLDRCFVDRSGLGFLVPGLLALVGLLFQPRLDGFTTIPDVAAHPIADWAVALVPPAVQGMNGDAQHLRDIRERHQFVTGLECHDHLPSRGSQFDAGLVPAESAWRPGALAGGAGASG
jgi:hypothetical protein